MLLICTLFERRTGTGKFEPGVAPESGVGDSVGGDEAERMLLGRLEDEDVEDDVGEVEGGVAADEVLLQGGEETLVEVEEKCPGEGAHEFEFTLC